MAVNLADDIFNCIFLNENDRIPIQISLKYVTRIPIDNKTDIDSGNGLVPNRTNDDPIYWRIYAALGGDEIEFIKSITASWYFEIFSMLSSNIWEQYCLW